MAQSISRLTARSSAVEHRVLSETRIVVNEEGGPIQAFPSCPGAASAQTQGHPFRLDRADGPSSGECSRPNQRPPLPLPPHSRAWRDVAKGDIIARQAHRGHFSLRAAIQAMKLSYDASVDIAYLDLDAEKKSAYSDEIAPGFVVDFSHDGGVVGLEIQDAHKRYPGIFSFEKSAQ